MIAVALLQATSVGLFMTVPAWRYIHHSCGMSARQCAQWWYYDV